MSLLQYQFSLSAVEGEAGMCNAIWDKTMEHICLSML